jgi:radical SAM protein with 4Fe4S-binding SPASM domain
MATSAEQCNSPTPDNPMVAMAMRTPAMVAEGTGEPIVRRRLPLAGAPCPVYVVWELTLRCDLRCLHCGSRAGDARVNELTTAEALGVVRQLAAMGTFEVALIGGEAYLHEGFLEIAAAIVAAGMRLTMTTGGQGITPELARAMAEAGFFSVSVSIDGLEWAHDRIRAKAGSFAAASLALGSLRAAGILSTCNTNINRLNLYDLEPLYEHIKRLGATGWQVQLTTPLGRAADRPGMILQPWDLLELLPRLVKLKERALEDGITMMPGNNIGYFGPEETRLRSPGRQRTDHWNGCQAGRRVLGIESSGAVKGCPSLQSATYVGGNLRKGSLQEIWDESPELAFTRQRTVDDLWGYCRSCQFAETCLAGCSFTAQALLGRRGNNPYCHFRARDFAKRGLRERLVPKESAPGVPFDNGCFEIVVEPLGAPDVLPERTERLLKVWRESAVGETWGDQPGSNR